MAGGGISGLAVAVVAIGGVLVYTAVNDIPLIDGLREFTAGRVPQGRPQRSTVVTFSGGSAPATAPAAPGETVPAAGGLGARIVASARQHLGKRYVWATAGPDTFDCSGLTSYVLRGLGVQSRRMVTQEYLVWTGAVTVPRDQCSPGDLVCWSGHIGIAVSKDRMINAPHTGAVVREDAIWRVPVPIIRRVKAATTTTGVV